MKEGKEGNNYAIYTNGERVDDGWKNERRPSDVALVYRFHTKSWGEYVLSRGKERRDSVAALIAKARSGRGIHVTAEIDPSAWEALKKQNPRHRFFDEDDPSTLEYSAVDPVIAGPNRRDEEGGNNAIPLSPS